VYVLENKILCDLLPQPTNCTTPFFPNCGQKIANGNPFFRNKFFSDAERGNTGEFFSHTSENSFRQNGARRKTKILRQQTVILARTMARL